MNIRKFAFWSLDFIKGSKIKKHYNQIKLINEAMQNNLEAALKLRNDNLENLLKHTKLTVPFYKNHKAIKGLKDFPVINKNSIVTNFESFQSKLYVNGKLHSNSTSGSTGVPFKLYWDQNKKQRNTADTIYFLNKAGYEIGNKLAYLGVYSHLKNRNSILKWLQNYHHFDLKKINPEEIHDILDTLATTDEKINLIGYPSNFSKLCEYLDSHTEASKNIKIESIIAIAEYLDSATRKSLVKHFNVPVVSRYSSQETGILAKQSMAENNGHFQINWASFYIEVLKIDEDITADAGEIGRIVITDLFNYAMPLVRYDIGDLGSFSELPSTSNPFPKFSRIEGKRMDAVFDTSGNQISAHFIDNLFYDYFTLLRQFQFIQTGEKEYLIKINTHSGEFDFADDLIVKVKALFGLDAAVKVELADEIAAISSGKRKMVKNTFLKTDA